MNNSNDFLYKTKKKFQNLKLVKFYTKWLSKPFSFIANAISWSVFAILLGAAAFLVYYYVSMQNYAKNGAGFEPKYYLYTIISGSMYPTIDIYDVVFVTRVGTAEEIKVDDIVSYNSSEFIYGESISVTHRVVEVKVDDNNNYTYVTKGDYNLAIDPKEVSFSQIDGVVTFKIPQLGRLQFFLASKVGWFVVIIVPALFILIKYVIKLLNLAGIFSSISSDSKFFPLFNKKLQLPQKSSAKSKTTSNKKTISNKKTTNRK